jgi:2-C-methyl-D-erythritol 4-phosphate cytidylyltransferase
MHVTAIVPAAGSGSRFGGVIPKQYLTLCGLPLLAWTLKALRASGRVDRVILVAPPGQAERCREEILRPSGLGVDLILPGGADRQASVYAGITGAPEDTELILVHDGARPLVTAEIIGASVDAAAAEGGAVAAVPVTDTIKMADPQGRILETPPRGRLWAAQTPQVFRADWLREAHARALADGYRGTDESVLVERLGYPVRLVPGSPENLKVTTATDLVQAERILRNRLTHGAGAANDQ